MPDINKTDLVARVRKAAQEFDGLRDAFASHEDSDCEPYWSLQTDADNAAGACKEAADALETQAAEISRLRDALRPFAEMIPTIFGPEYLDRSRVSIEGKHGYASVQTALHVGDFRRARTALEANHG